MIPTINTRIQTGFGRTLGLGRHLLASSATLAGVHAEFNNIEWNRVSRVVFVCKGNICRSPYAEKRAQALGLRASSAGLASHTCGPAHETIQKIGRARGLELAGHRSRRYPDVDLLTSDLVVCFEPAQARAVREKAEKYGAQVTLLGLYSSPARPHIEDPYGLSDPYFETCCNLIDSGVAKIKSNIFTGLRAQRRVLVVQAESLGALAVIRSLGHAGYSVHAAASEKSALGLKSRYAARATIMPAYKSPRFLSWLRAYISANSIDAIVPSEGFLLAIEPHFAEFADLLPYGPDKKRVYSGMSKYDFFQSFAHEPNIPQTVFLDFETGKPDWQKVSEQLQVLTTPLFIKTDGLYSLAGEAGSVHKIASAEEAVLRLQLLTTRFKKVIVQEFVPGRGTGACFVMDQGTPLAQFQHLRLHEVPHTGGASSLRTSFRHEAMRADALRRLQGLKWQGPAMLEYRWDEKTDNFFLMEMNGRFWGSLHLALHAGVNFPLALIDKKLGVAQVEKQEYPEGVLCRNTFPGEVHHLLSVCRDGNICVRKKINAAAKFVALSFSPAVVSDLSYPGDRGLYFSGMANFLRSTVTAAFTRLLRSIRPTPTKSYRLGKFTKVSL